MLLQSLREGALRNDQNKWETTTSAQIPDQRLLCFGFRHLFDVAQYSPIHSAKHMQQIVKNIHKRFTENRDRQGR